MGTTKAAAAKKVIPPKVGRKPPKVLAEQAANRREAKRDGIPIVEAKLTPFAERFCVEFVRCGILEDAHRATEVGLRVPLDMTGFDVFVEETENTIKGRLVKSKVYHITDSHGRPVSENDLRLGSAANLYALPEVRQRIRDLRAEAGKLLRITAESLAEECDQIQLAAMKSGQLQVAANLVAMKGKMFGIEAGSADPGATPVTAVEIRIRDYTGKPKASKELDN